MTERLGRPRTAIFPPLRPEHVQELTVGHQLGRIYASRGLHPTTWSQFRTWGPTSARFDHHPGPLGDHPRRGVMYVAPSSDRRSRTRQPVLRTCLAEVYRDRGIVELARDRPYFALFGLDVPLRLLDLADSTWVTEAGGNAAISSGLRSASRDWARAIHRHYPDVDGVLYTCSNIPSARSVALWKRAKRAVPTRPRFNRPLDDASLRPAIETYARDLDLDLVP